MTCRPRPSTENMQSCHASPQSSNAFATRDITQGEGRRSARLSTFLRRPPCAPTTGSGPEASFDFMQVAYCPFWSLAWGFWVAHHD